MKNRILAALVIGVLGIFSIAAQKKSDSMVKEISQFQFSSIVSPFNGGYAKWSFKGDKPVIVDFYAMWCGPCRKLSPIVEELANEYKGKVEFYKVDIDKNVELAKAYNIASIPMLLLAPVNGEPQIITGLYPKEEIVKAMDYVFWSKK